MPVPDPHSHYDDTQPVGHHLVWRANVDLERRVIDADLTITFGAARPGPIDLDARNLTVHGVVGPTGAPLEFSLTATDEILGDRLRVWLPEGVERVTISYATSPAATALQWLAPAQTSGGRHSFLYSQSQTIHARSFLPLQDTPLARVTYDAEITAPDELAVLMAAEVVSREVLGDGRTRHCFTMPRSVPPYLVSFAVGALEGRAITDRTTIWAEPEALDAAAWEFAEIGAIFDSAETVLGPYVWGRFDLLVLPPSYPYGGMENPGLAFLTPTLLAGDRSLVNVAAHELAHAWTGNLVTNASYDDFWLNEGFTIFAERKIIEALEGVDVAEMHASIGRADLDGDLGYFADRPELTRLRRDLRGVDPDKASSYVALEKGYLFLRAIEESVGRDAFAEFLHGYLQRHQFTSITTAEFLADARSHLGDVVDYGEWLDGSGLPDDAPKASSARLDAVRSLGSTAPSPEVVSRWTSVEWQVYLSELETPVPLDVLTSLDETFGLTDSSNAEIRFWWLLAALRSGYEPAVAAAVDMVARTGRLKFLKPLYDALADLSDDRALARECFARNRDFYHPIAVAVVASRLDRALPCGAPRLDGELPTVAR